MLWRIVIGLVASVLFSGLVRAESYVDDRSGAAQLVRSLYNAINAHEFARAYDYFASPPAKDFDTYQQGFEGTARVDVMIGKVGSDGAAGTIYYSVPTLIKSSYDKGAAKVFAGCYTVKAVSAAAQEPPYRPLQIDKGALKLVKADDFNTYSFPDCGASADESEAVVTVEDAKALFVAEQAGHCDKVEETRAGLNEPEAYSLKYKSEGAAGDEPLQMVKVFMFTCSTFAYNQSSVFYMADSVNGLRLMSFAEPHMVITHPKGDDEGKVLKSMQVRGFTSSTELINAEFDDKVSTITSFSKWRGIGDASSSGIWKFDQGEFILDSYDVDPTYNEEMDPIAVMASGKLLTLP
jgi:Protein of unknown function (DUF1176)